MNGLFIVVPVSPALKAALAANPGWGRVAERSGMAVYYVNRPQTQQALQALGGKILGSAGRQSRLPELSVAERSKLGLAAVSDKVSTEDVISSLLGGDNWNFDW